MAARRTNSKLPGTTPGVWALIGLAGVMRGVTRSPFTAIVFAVELTHDASSLLDLLDARQKLLEEERKAERVLLVLRPAHQDAEVVVAERPD